jgi:methionyl-tRNA formyltransferase
MKVLFLGPPPPPEGEATLPPVATHIARTDQLIVASDRLTPAFLDAHQPDFLVSHGYRHILKPEVLARFPGRAVNLHISLLPWNRGADPNLWSFLDDTPKGVSIHHIDPGVDTGDLIVQTVVSFGPHETLRTSYERLQQEIIALFCEHWPDIRDGRAPGRAQQGPGTSHRLRDKEPWVGLLTKGWETPVASLVGAARPRNS